MDMLYEHLFVSFIYTQCTIYLVVFYVTGASYLDDIVWRVVSRLLNDILSTNKLSLTFNVLGAAANQTASVVREVAGALHCSLHVT